MGASVSMSDQVVSVVPGEKAGIDVTIRNNGAVVDQFVLDVLGGAASWATVEPSSVNLMPDQEATARIEFAPPRESAVPAEEVYFALRVMPMEDTENTVVDEGVVDVLEFHELAAEFAPPKASGRRRGRTRLAVDNLGNGMAFVALRGIDPADEVGISFHRHQVDIPPGRTVLVKTVVRPWKRFFRGPDKTHKFDVDVTPSHGTPVKASATYVQQQLVPKGLFAAMGLAVAGAVVIAAMLMTVLKPKVVSTAQAGAPSVVANSSSSGPSSGPSSGSSSSNPSSSAGPSSAAGSSSSGAPSGGAVPGQPTSSSPEPTDFRIVADPQPGPKYVDFPYTPPAGKTLYVSDIIIENPNGDLGTLLIKRDANVLMQFGLANFKDMNRTFAQPIVFRPGQRVVVSVRCDNAGDTRCGTSVYFNGQVR
ncbi:COG1470 family protein [Lentzea sp. E54]|uniref:COG1470 family protein n=1 Tax=Lentzea xerophila TaxID=3435883 RepID=UPI003DA46383